MTCKGDTYKAWGFDGCARKALVNRYRAMWQRAEPIIIAGKELKGFRKLDGVVLGKPL